MSTVADQMPVAELPIDRSRGRQAMVMFIATEAMLFVVLFFGYFYLGSQQPRWPMDQPPELKLALIMLGVLLASSAVLYGAEQLVEHRNKGGARALVGVTLLLGCVFMALQVMEYRHHLESLRPTTDAYGSIFYTITTVHGAHIVFGLLMLAYAITLPLEPVDKPPHKPLRNTALYWHFVDVMWIFIVLLLYVLPHLWGPKS